MVRKREPARRATRLAVALLCATALGWGCSGDKAAARGQIMVAFDTDMTVPRDVSKVNVQIKVNGRIEFSNEYEVGPGGKVRLPATLAIVAPEGGTSAPVTIKVVGLKGTTARTLRQVVTKVPSDRIALLPMKVQWLCDGSAVTAGPEEYASTCPTEGQSCEAGSCVPDEIPVEALPSYEAKSVFGGASDPNQGTCFDTVACFSQGFGVTPRSSDCTLDPIGATEGEGADLGLSFAMVRPPDTEGICGPEACLVPLDAESTAGWRRDDASGRIVFPQAVCERLAEGKILGVAATKTCPTKTSSLPVCGDWSSVPTNPGTFDAGAPPLEAGEDAPKDSPDCQALRADATAKVELARACDPSRGCAVPAVQFDCAPVFFGAPAASAEGVAANAAIEAYAGAGCVSCPPEPPDAAPPPTSAACVDEGGSMRCVPQGSGSDSPSCLNGIQDGDELGVDCGGAGMLRCAPCALGTSCTTHADCMSSYCDSGSRTCACPPDMVPRSAPNGNQYCVDRYEVTKAQYQAFEQMSPSTVDQPPECATVNTTAGDYAPQFGWPPGASPDPARPVVGVDWCDAFAYCQSIGKRLCGRPGGGATLYSAFDQRIESQWYDSCAESGTSGGPATPDPVDCNYSGDAYGASVEGTALTLCSTPSGVFNLAGNVAEWEDSCNGTTGSTDSCQVRGGHYASDAFAVVCAAQDPQTRGTVDQFVGFRCCGGDWVAARCNPGTCPAGPSGAPACCTGMNGACGWYPLQQPQTSCTRDSDCPSGGECQEGWCVAVDAGCAAN